jgi:TusA-related sulfurtransferase
MPALAAKLAIAVAAAVVAWTGIEAVRSRQVATTVARREPEALAEEWPQEVPRLLAVVVHAVEPETAPSEAPALGGVAAMARIHGRVVGVEKADDIPELNVEDGTHSYHAAVEDDGRFEINLPAGSYTLVAAASNRIAAAEVADLAEDEDRDITLVLGLGVSIQGRVGGPEEVFQAASIQATRSGTAPASSGVETTGEFSLDGLIPGKAYDVVVSAPGMRRVLLENVVAPKAGLVLNLEPAPSLRGGFGLAVGQKCPMEVVRMVSASDSGNAGEVLAVARFDRDCRFAFPQLQGAKRLHMAAEGWGWHFEAEVDVPEHGDPPFLCLREPCRDVVAAPTATLEVMLQGAQGETWVVAAHTSTGYQESSCDSSNGPCSLADLPSGEQVEVFVTAKGCRREQREIDLLPGNNMLAVVCVSERMVQGVLRASASKEAPFLQATIRCSPEGQEVKTVGRLFQLKCPDRLSTVEYQLSSDGPWLTAPIRSNGPEGAGFVEIP